MKTYNNLIKPPAITPCYSQYAGEMLYIAEKVIAQNHFRRALSLLNAARTACSRLQAIDSLRLQVYGKLVEHRLSVSRHLLEQDNLAASRDTLLKITKDYPSLSGKAGRDKDITNMAEAIFFQTIEKGARLHAQNRNEQAFDFLSSATQLQHTFSLPASQQLDTLIAQTTVPCILSIADEANLEIWKKHFQKADSIYRLAQSLSLRYRVSENNKIKNTLDALSVKIKVAGCQWKQEKIASLFTQTNRAVRAYQMVQAKSYFIKAKKLYAGAGSCQLNKKQTDSAFEAYEKLFRFTDEYHQLTLQLFNKGFAVVLPGFVKLEKQYQAGNLKKFGLPFTGLYPFVRSQRSEQLTMEAVQYFIQNKAFAKALRYLQLSGNVAKAKSQQKQIALGLANKSIQPRSLFLTQPEWAYFAKMYRKALTAKGK